MEQKQYNGELKSLYYDLDKRITLSESHEKTLWEAHDIASKTREQYLHTRFHDVLTDIAAVRVELELIKNILNKLPCEGRLEKIKSISKDIGWLQRITYTALCIIIPSLVTLGIVWGSMVTTVSFHEHELASVRKTIMITQDREI